MTANSMNQIYQEYYAWQQAYDGLEQTRGAFAIIAGTLERRPAVCLQQRNGKGPPDYRYRFELPGGGMRTDPTLGPVDADVRAACVRRARAEVNVDCQVVAAIGPPLYRILGGKLDLAQAFLVETADVPCPSEDAPVVVFAHQDSFVGFNAVGRSTADPTKPAFGRMPIMIWDGLSVLQKPFWVGRLTKEIRAAIIIGDPDGSDFFLVDGGAYLGKTFVRFDQRGRRMRYVALYWRLNPDQPNGRFSGRFDYLTNRPFV